MNKTDYGTHKVAEQDPHSRAGHGHAFLRRGLWRRAARLAQRPGRRPVYGAIDLGTNNCRMLIASPAKGGFRVLDAFSRIVRLGEGVARSGSISEAATERVIEALKICAQKLSRRNVTLMRSVGTEACRIADNAGTLVDLIWAETGLAIDIISAREEARLAMLGCQGLMKPATEYSLVFDIGGGSTETVLVENGPEGVKLLDWISVPFGVVRLAERFGGGGLEPQAFDQLKAEIKETIADFASRIQVSKLIGNGGIQLLGSSGTVTTLAGLELGLKNYDRSRVDGAEICCRKLSEVAREVALADHETRAAKACIGEDRADLIVPGCAILCALLETWPASHITVADRGIREGILRALMAPAPRNDLARGDQP